jgi:hypothetical protein
MIAQVMAPASKQALTFRVPAGGTINSDGSRTATLSHPESVQRWSAIERLDREASENTHITGRLALSRQSEPDFIWSPYPDFISPLDQNNLTGLVAVIHNLRPSLSLELRAGFDRDLLNWDRGNSQMPALKIVNSPNLLLPGSPANFVLRNAGSTFEYHGNLMWVGRRHVLKGGGGSIVRLIAGRISVINGGPALNFPQWSDFANGQPASVRLPESRDALLNGFYQPPDMSRAYRYIQSFGFLQDSYRLTPRLMLHIGIRYDLFGAPRNIGTAKDWLLQLQPGVSDWNQLLPNAKVVPPSSGNSPLYSQDNNDWAPRIGFIWNVNDKGSLLLRGAYGVYYNRPFDNLWLNLRFNNALPVVADLQPGTVLPAYESNTLSGFASAAALRQTSSGLMQLFPDWKEYGLTLYQPGIRTPYVQSYFLGLEHQLSSSVLAELYYAGSQGRKLITTDRINRPNLSNCPGGDDRCRPNPALRTDIDYRANQGKSSYNSLTASLHWRTSHSEARLNYTWSHAIDDQSDPLQGLLASNLEITNVSGGTISPRPAAFTQQYSNTSDRGNADFDQRHSLTGLVSWIVPPVSRPHAIWIRDWTLSAIGAVRSGTPYGIYTGFVDYPFFYNRPDLISQGFEFLGTGPTAAGKQLLNSQAFAIQSARLGNVGRNAFTGPRFYNFDFSISRGFAIGWGDHTIKLRLRADAYNLLNHVNLANPNVLDGSAFLSNRNFGLAPYGRPIESGGPLSFLPLAESSRQLQLMLQIIF